MRGVYVPEAPVVALTENVRRAEHRTVAVVMVVAPPPNTEYVPKFTGPGSANHEH
jgi:hypothetical protein